MPPKMFKIKKAGQVKEEADEGLITSDYQQQRLETQTHNAEGQQKEEAKRQLAAESDAAAVAAVKREVEADAKGAKGAKAAGSAPFGGGGVSSGRSAPVAYTAVTHGVADALPVNTMDAVLSAPLEDPNALQPLALNPHSVAMYGTEGAGAGAGALTAVHPAAPARSGTAFLEEGHNELLASYAANKAFFDAHGRAGGDDSDNAYGAEGNGASAAGTDDAFMLMQLPRPVSELTAALSLDQMAPGKIGKLTVYKSGRATMTIGGVVVDVALEPHRSQPQQEGGQAQSAAVQEGMSQYAVAVDSTDLARRGCYQLCWIPRKVVCTPKLEDE